MACAVEPQTIERVRSELGLDEQTIKRAVRELKHWLRSESHLPDKCDEKRLERWLIRCKNDLEKTKNSLDMYYTVRTAAPDLFCKRDTSSDWFEHIVSVGYCCPLPQLTPQCERIIALGCLDPDPSNCNVLHIMKMMFMVQDIRMCEDYCTSDIIIMDFRNFALGHVTQISLPIMKKLEVCAVKAYSTRIKAIHLINIPSYAYVIVNMLKYVMPPKVADRIHVHAKEATTLQDHIPTTLLPKDYGGESSSIEETWAVWITKLKSYRSWFLKEEKYKSNERRRRGGPVDSGELFGFGIMSGIRRLASNFAPPALGPQQDMTYML